MPRKIDREFYRKGMELTGDGGPVTFGTGTADLVTKGLAPEEIVDAVARRNGLPTTADLRAASALLSQIESMIKQARRGPCPREEAWRKYKTSGVLVSPD